MTQMKITPGEWLIQRTALPSGRVETSIVDKNETEIAHIADREDTAEIWGNQYVIWMAPDLLMICEMILTQAKLGHVNAPESTLQWIREVVDRARGK